MSEVARRLGAAPLRRFKPYPGYKDSGVEWLGEIPLDWEPFPLGRLGSFSASGIDKKTVEGEAHVTMVNYTDVYSNTSKTLDRSKEYMHTTCPGHKAKEHSLLRGDILFTPSSETEAEVGFSAVVTEDMPGTVYSYHLIRFRPGAHTVLDTAFSKYFCNNTVALAQFSAACKGTTRQILTREDFKAIAVVLPPLSEQRPIATFLDRETARIDALVAKKERLIGLLREQRTALITCAVTKGLDPTVPMKDSGVEWLGELPAHWEVLAVKRRAKRIQTGTTPPTTETKYYEDGVVAWYGPGSFADDLPLQAPSKYIAESAVRDGVARVFESGTAAIVTIGATLGKVAFMERSGSCNQQITGVTFDAQRVHAKYGAYQLKRLEPVLRGIAPNTTLPILDQEEVGYLPFVLPPGIEQRAIAAFLDRETARIDALVAKIVDAIERLKELRTALICAAVTGRIDVREEVA